MNQDQLREAIEDCLSWSPYDEVQRHRAEVIDAAIGVVAPLLADREAKIDRLMGSRRIATRMLADTVGENAEELGSLEEAVTEVIDRFEELEASRRDWATEALRLRMEIEKLREIALDPNALYSSILVGVGGEAGTVPSDGQVKLAVGLFLRHVGRDLADPDWHPKDDCGRGPLCRRHGCVACIAAADPDLAGPQCSVHPDRGGNDD